MAEEKLKEVDTGKVYMVNGAWINKLIKSIITEILTYKDELLATPKKPNKVEIRMAGEWRTVVDCDDNEYQILTRPVPAEEEDDD